MMKRQVWLSRRALKLHGVILVVVPGFMALCVWQIYRAVSGNELSWAYVFEWPFFAAYAIYMWWRLVHEAPEVPEVPETSMASPAVPQGADSSARNETVTPDEPDVVAAEDAELTAYNAYLAQLAAQDRAAGR